MRRLLAMLLIPASLGVRGVDRLLDLPPEERAQAIRQLAPDEQQAIYLALRYDWRRWARPEQLAPEAPWDIWVLLAGRGGGKTRPAAQLVNEWAANPEYAEGNQPRIALVGRTKPECEKIMVNGESGIVACSPPWFQATYHPSKDQVVWPATESGPGAVAELHSADEPRSLRGPQYHKGWGDEFASWKCRPGEKPEAWDNGLDMCVRLGTSPQIILTSTPRPTDFVRDVGYGPKQDNGNRLVSAAQLRPDPAGICTWRFAIAGDNGTSEVTVVSSWPTERNRQNLAPTKVAKWRAKYRNTRLAAQELDGRILDRVEGALWTEERLLDMHIDGLPQGVRLVRKRVALDPTRADDPVDECGLMVGGVGSDGRGYLLADLTLTGSPATWAAAGVSAAPVWGAAAIVYENNAFGDKEREVLATAGYGGNWVGVKAVEDKLARASPISALCEQGRISHLCPKPNDHPDDPCDHFAELEAELTGWDPKTKKSPNRLDAYVWLFTDLMLGLHPATAAPPRNVGTRKSPWKA